MAPRLEEPETFGAVYRDHYDSVFATVNAIVRNRHVAEEITQDVFTALWRRPSAFDARRGELGPFLRLLGRSRAVDSWRSTRAGGVAQERLQTASSWAGAATTDALASEVERRTEGSVLRDAVRGLPEAQQRTIALAYWGGLTGSEIADRMSVPLGTVKSRLRIGLSRLQERDLVERSAG